MSSSLLQTLGMHESPESSQKPRIVVLGGSYTGCKAAEYLASAMHKTHQVVIVEKNTHFQHLFVLPRFAVVPGYEHLAFIPYTTSGLLTPSFFMGRPRPTWWSEDAPPTPADAIAFVHAEVTTVLPDRVILKPSGSGSAPGELVYEYLVVATGTTLPPPGTLNTEGKSAGMSYLQEYQRRIAAANDIVIIGGGAIGVQMATDIKEQHPTKTITLVHSRAQLMPTFHPRLHALLMDRFKELGINTVLGERVRVPAGGFPVGQGAFNIALSSGAMLLADFAILSTGQVPLSAPLRGLGVPEPELLTPSGHVQVKRTLQLPRAPHVFALGDVADTGDQKAARPAWPQAHVIAENVWRLHMHKSAGRAGEPELMEHRPLPAGIRMSLGFERSIIFRNPPSERPDAEPMYNLKNDGEIDLEVMSQWETRAPEITDYYA